MQRPDGFDLDHHGDLEVGHGLVDLAVNVRTGTPPAWLVEEIAGSLTDLASYPRQEPALAAVAARHHCEPEQVLLTAGAAEAFVLIARAFKTKHPVVVHPQFTEPEAALRSAGHLVDRVILRPEDRFVLDPRAVPADADLVVIGNPTNPTSVLHRADDLRELARPDRILVVDEAFMDAVPGEPESLVGASIPGLIVIRSLTKTWGLAGLRVGYVVAAAGLIEQLAAVQPQWPVSTPALAAAIACSNKRALEESAQAALEIDRHRAYLLDGLGCSAGPPGGAASEYGVGGSEYAGGSSAYGTGGGSEYASGASEYASGPSEYKGVETFGVARGPFVLVRVEGAAMLRERLRERGFAVRRGDTFPGLGPDWLRIAVRPDSVTDGFLKVWRDLLG
ncbi:Rv2231c family pyridoxal phosphate-dependent protein CobC [Kribbella sp. VKM Ac-2568]|uniref:Rv2231c family pyridoxal phosphate-dependent protein CobC n=1 Tax=Kribbella sp. VKM Ac-2568 TaxID=2512219 RepID=UPI001051F663|nr:histidinol-phosphate aminotransferase [Kribbella sp. VKM Ac-2568]